MTSISDVDAALGAPDADAPALEPASPSTPSVPPAGGAPPSPAPPCPHPSKYNDNVVAFLLNLLADRATGLSKDGTAAHESLLGQSMCLVAEEELGIPVSLAGGDAIEPTTPFGWLKWSAIKYGKRCAVESPKSPLRPIVEKIAQALSPEEKPKKDAPVPLPAEHEAGAQPLRPEATPA